MGCNKGSFCFVEDLTDQQRSKIYLKESSLECKNLSIDFLLGPAFLWMCFTEVLFKLNVFHILKLLHYLWFLSRFLFCIVDLVAKYFVFVAQHKFRAPVTRI